MSIFELRVFTFYSVSYFYVLFKFWRFLKFFLFQVFFRKNSDVISFALGSILIASFLQWTLLAFLHIKIIVVVSIIFLIWIGFLETLFYS